MRMASIIILGLAVTAGRATAQVPALREGDTVRVVAPTVGPGIRGALAAVRNDTLYVRRYGVMLAVPMSRVERIEVRRKRSLLAGLGRGVVFGAAIGLVSGYLTGAAAEGPRDQCADDCGLLPVVGAATGLGAGVVVGGIVGLGAPGGRWERVEPRGGMRVGATPGGVTLGIDLKM